jgi:repressor LexA
MPDFTPAAAKFWRDLGPAVRDAITTSVWCVQCRVAVEIVDFAGEEKPGGILLRGRCKICGGLVARYVEGAEPQVATSAPESVGPTGGTSFSGLDSRIACRLFSAGYRTREQVLTAVRAGWLGVNSPDRPRQYGRIYHQRVLEWLGLPVPEPLPLKPSTGYTDKQGQYLAFIHYYTKVNGCPPAEADFQRYFQVSPPSVHAMIVALEKRGFISRVPGKGRSISLNLGREQLPDLE